jgi:CubicO group peptidase (beta-lactamase class C family)
MTHRIVTSLGPAAAVCLALLLPAAVLAQQAPDANPVAARVDAVFADYDKPDSPGCALGVYKDGAIVYSRGYGMADLERGVPITPRTVFDIGSTSKQFSAAAIVLLAQDGKLTLDDDVRRWVPELPDYGTPITIRQMLLHTSGLRDYIGLLTLAGHRTDDVTDAEDALRIIARQKALNFAPGAEHLYSNSGYFLLSTVVERASGKTLQAFARERIFAPLGMTKTHYLGRYDDIVPDRALAYAPRQGGGLRQDISRWLQVGDGAVFTTVEELLHWDNNFYDPKVGGPALLDALQAPGSLNGGKPLTYALGLGIGTYRGQRTVSHGGSWGGYRAELLRFPDQRFSVATLCNLGTVNPTQLARRVADVYLEAVLAPVAAAATPVTPAATLPAEALSAYAGLYRHPVTRARLNVTLLNAQLTVLGDGRFELRPRAPTVFEADGTSTTWTFEASDAGGPARLTRKQDGLDPEVFEKVTPLKPTAAELELYAGRYYSEELDATFTLASEEGALMLRRRGASPQRLVPIVGDEFMAGSVTVRFERAADGAVSGYVMDLGRVRNLRFERVRER